MRTLLSGFDDRGKVYDLGDVIERTIDDAYRDSVASLHRIFKERRLVEKGIVETELRGDGRLEHRKLVTSYPYEWPASMYKDAALFHLRLFTELESAGLTLKDALPSNIVFDGTAPVFVDFLSMLPLGKLKDEAWLEPGGYADARNAVADRMLFPYVVLPLLFMGRGEYGVARELLSTRSCNTGGKPPSWRELLRPVRHGYLASLAAAAKLMPIRRTGRSRPPGAFPELVRWLEKLVAGIDVTPPLSAYASYYDEKKEASSFDDPARFLPKQKTVHDLLREKRPATVLDIGANTGWYSVLAARLGAKVIAIEADESCADILYRRAKKDRAAILALKASFSDLDREVHPLYRPAVERIGADLVLALGVFHHLVLGEGRAMEEVLATLARLARKTLVLEFVALDDEKIVEEPSFFRNLHRQTPASYNLERLLEAGRRHFANGQVRASNPATRTIVVFDK